MVKNLPPNAGDAGDLSSIPGSGRSPGGNGNLLQYSCLENPMMEESGRLQSDMNFEAQSEVSDQIRSD